MHVCTTIMVHLQRVNGETNLEIIGKIEKNSDWIYQLRCLHTEVYIVTWPHFKDKGVPASHIF